jgi:hypothetical protein
MKAKSKYTVQDARFDAIEAVLASAGELQALYDSIESDSGADAKLDRMIELEHALCGDAAELVELDATYSDELDAEAAPVAAVNSEERLQQIRDELASGELVKVDQPDGSAFLYDRKPACH